MTQFRTDIPEALFLRAQAANPGKNRKQLVLEGLELLGRGGGTIMVCPDERVILNSFFWLSEKLLTACDPIFPDPADAVWQQASLSEAMRGFVHAMRALQKAKVVPFQPNQDAATSTGELPPTG